MNRMLMVCMWVLVTFCSAGFAFAAEPPNLAVMDEKSLLARARLLTQEELNISRRAVEQAHSQKVRAFAKRVAVRSEALDKKLTELAKAAGVDAAEIGSEQLSNRVEAIQKLQGEAFDPDYLKLILDFHGEHLVIYERLSKIADTAQLREFASSALAEERNHLKIAQEIAAPMIPHAKTPQE